MQAIGKTVFAAVMILMLSAAAAQGEDIRRVGQGSYATAPPPGGPTPPRTIYATENVRGKMPTNRWWSSLAWLKYSAPQYPHPLAVQAVARGLRIDYPGPNIATDGGGIIGSMPADGSEDLLLGFSTADEFPDACVNGFSDWFVRARFATPNTSLTVSYGHGSPFVYALCKGGLQPRTVG